MSADQINDGGPAFPAPPGSAGMSLRDYFAAQAMIGICMMNSTGAETVNDDDHLARSAWAKADAMLKAREIEQ